ncbi:tRNA glutamyl-Q(34) synthetase GluQRS [uncultured Paludibaculum sp.]|uniref:tRNA glutamyl-Q(34) synthetase GluQRS n=1 Tax=uncultured Paludibaculum sp. TaxID=1765020 RepID=UPI002AAAE508|nr:tRNA glutamyl-Q(34) synthetase GluQRS [uncultured Paludibaculum sp.]
MSYRGRFAPSPTGPLHAGSLVAAVASYLDARRHGGRWLVRIEDVDEPRTAAGAADVILRTLEACGLEWDEPVVYQSRRKSLYREALDDLIRIGEVFPCACTRKEIADSTISTTPGAEVPYPGTCRSRLPPGRAPRAWRVKVPDGLISFVDRRQGSQQQNLRRETGDFVVLRADGFFAYQLAVVVDDADQGITDVVRGEDLLASTPRQIYLQRLLGYPHPRYLHFPVVRNATGDKLSKQTGAAAIDPSQPGSALRTALLFLGIDPPPDLSPAEVLKWAILRG